MKYVSCRFVGLLLVAVCQLVGAQPLKIPPVQQVSGDGARSARAIGAESTSVKDFGATGDCLTDDAPAFNAAIARVSANGGGVVFVPSTGACYVANARILLKAGVELRGIGKPLVKFTNAATNGDLSVEGSDTAIRGLKLQIRTAQLVFLNGAISRFALEDNDLHDAGVHSGIMFHVNSIDSFDIVVRNNRIRGGNYGVLVNERATGGRMMIDGNIITDSKSIEINSLRGFGDITINNNILDASNAGGANDDFAVGIARANRVVVSNNRIVNSRLEAIHIEDASLDVLIIGNNITTTNSHGIKVIQANSAGGSRNHIIANNLIRFVGSPVGANGIQLVYDPSGSVSDVSITGNKIVNFSTGIALGAAFAGDGGTGLVQGNTVDDCAVGIAGYRLSEQVRDNVMHSVRVGFVTNYGGIVGMTMFTGVMPGTLASNTSNGLVLKGLKFSILAWKHGGGQIRFVSVAAAPSTYLGEALAEITTASASNWGIRSKHFTWDGVADTTQHGVSKSAGTVSVPEIRVSGGFVQVGAFSAVPETFRIDLTLYGAYVI